MDYINYNDIIRNKCVTILNKIITNEKKTKNFEKYIYNHVIKQAKELYIPRLWTNNIFKNLYKSKIRSFYSNISDIYINNVNFKNKILNNEIKPDELCNMSIYDIYPEKWSFLIDKKSKQDKIKYEYKPEAMTDQFKCRKCNSRSCSYYEVQTRSADEPMTQFISCLDCGSRWRN